MEPTTSSVSTVHDAGRYDVLLAWSFVLVWGSGYLASKVGMQYAPPFTFLSLRFAVAMICVIPWVILARARWPANRREFFHIAVAGLLMHAANLAGSHYTQYLGMSAGITALLLATQPLFTAVFAHYLMSERLVLRQWLGVALGLAGVVLIVWHKINLQAITIGSLIAVTVSLVSITSGTLYQRTFCRTVDLRSAALIQFVLSFLVVAPLAWAVEGFSVNWSWSLASSVLFLVIFGSIVAVNALHTLMRRGHAAKVTSLFLLTPAVAVFLEWLMFSVVPTWLSIAGTAITCGGVALVTQRRRGVA